MVDPKKIGSDFRISLSDGMGSFAPMTPLERAARALFKHEPGPYGDCVDWAIEQPFGWRDRVDEVQIVLDAIRTPSRPMWDAAVPLLTDPMAGASVIWNTMIDAMLEEG